MVVYYKQEWFKFIYRISVLILWFLLGMFLQTLVEYPIIIFLTKDFQLYSLGLSYNQWQLLHIIVAFLIIIFSTVAGLYFGLIWYEYVYEIHHGKIRKLVSK
ncbi:MAG: hypothetical protein WC860_08655 [Candidatus Margulisiibacteriota bacterium]|jgi:hypothetical protein